MRRLRLRVDRRARLSSSVHVLGIKATIHREGLVDRVRVRCLEAWRRALAVRCIRRGRFRRARVVREDLGLLRDRALVADRDDLGLGIGQELLRAG